MFDVSLVHVCASVDSHERGVFGGQLSVGLGYMLPVCVCAFLCVRVRVCVRLSIHTSRSLHQFFEERAGSYVALGAWTALSGDQQWYETYAPSALPDEPQPRSFHKSVFVSLCLVLCPRSAHCESQVVVFRPVSVCVLVCWCACM
jgi:hypothetical protein